MLIVAESRKYNIPIINYCENHLFYFHSNPNIFKGFIRSIWHNIVFGNMPILNFQYESLRKIEEYFLKWLFDIILSGIFIVTIFKLVYMIAGVICLIYVSFIIL